MKVLIPFSGGINSTYGLWRWLSETDHEIHAYRHVEHFEPEERKQVAARNMVQWLKDNVRDFNFWEEDEILEPAVRTPVFLPVRLNFTKEYDRSFLDARWARRLEVIDRIKPDAFVNGLSLEQTHFDWPVVRVADIREKFFSNREGLSYYFVGSKALDTPYPSEYFLNPVSVDEWMAEKWVPIVDNLTGRFEQWEAVPAELKALYAAPHVPRHDHTNTFCFKCLWEAVQEYRTDLTGREKDLALAELGNYGPFRNNANPETQAAWPHVTSALEILKDYLKWPEGVEW